MLSPQSPSNTEPYNQWDAIREPEPNRHFFARLLEAWYRLTAPPAVPANADVHEREIVRRGRLASIILIFSLFNTLIGIPTSFLTKNIYLPIILIVFAILELFAFVLNRYKQTAIAGLICVVGLEIGLMGSVFSYPLLTPDNMQILDLLILPLIYAASLLPSGSAFLVMIINCIFIVMSFNMIPHSAEINFILAHQGGSLLARSLTIQVIVATVTHIWVRSANHAIIRADRSDAIALLERTLARKNHVEIEQKHILEAGINEIVQVIAGIAQDPLNTIVSDPGKPLWQIVAALNNLRKRLVRLGQEATGHAEEAEQLRKALASLLKCLSEAPDQLSSWQTTNTPVDDIIKQITTFNQSRPSSNPRLKKNILL